MAKRTDKGREPGDHETMDRSDEVAASAEPQGDGAPAEDSADSYLATDGSAAESSGATVVSEPEGSSRALDEQRDKYLRLMAEYDNYRKRSTRERQEAGARAQAELVKQLIDALDDLARFAHLDPTTVDTATVVQGAEMVEKKLYKALSSAGLETVNPHDQPFNPERHEAVATEPALSREDDHVVARVYQQGYLFNGQLLRPARVVVKQWNG